MWIEGLDSDSELRSESRTGRDLQVEARDLKMQPLRRVFRAGAHRDRLGRMDSEGVRQCPYRSR